ncbi:MAG: protein translocase subunit SecF [Thermodesulfobacteriota bacterium]|nr:protein translocase subunit SecF [Thermodesulfobacteriota bacterium]
MQIIKPGTNINFVGQQKFAFIVSVLLILITIVSLIIHKGPNYGIDFSGGTLVQVAFDKPVDISKIKTALKAVGIDVSTVQEFGKQDPGDCQYLIHTAMTGITGGNFSDKVTGTLKDVTGLDAKIVRVEMVGPKVGEDLREQALFALFFALLFINIYISGRFELKWLASAIVAGGLIVAVKLFSVFDVSIPYLILLALIVSLILFWVLELKYAMGAIVALIHDVTITVGIFSITGKEFTLPIIAALLTIIGYSLNDTIIVFDRIRENLRKYNRKSMAENINGSINETLSRTLLTSITTLVVVVTLFVLGGNIIHDFAFAMIIGVLIGTYSSVFVASPILLLWLKK